MGHLKSRVKVYRTPKKHTIEVGYLIVFYHGTCFVMNTLTKGSNFEVVSVYMIFIFISFNLHDLKKRNFLHQILLKFDQWKCKTFVKQSD